MPNVKNEPKSTPSGTSFQQYSHCQFSKALVENIEYIELISLFFRSILLIMIIIYPWFHFPEWSLKNKFNVDKK